MGMMLVGLNRYKQPRVLHVTVYITKSKTNGTNVQPAETLTRSRLELSKGAHRYECGVVYQHNACRHCDDVDR